MSRVQQGVNDLYTWCLNNGEFGQRLINEWTGLDENNIKVDMDSVSSGSHKRVKWRCNNGHEWTVDIHNRTRSKTRCAYCFGNHKIPKERNLQEWCLNNGEFGQQLMDEWVGEDESNQPISMDSVARAAKKKVKWRCKNGHEWYATIVHRTVNNRCCPYCYNERRGEKAAQAKLDEGVNDLQTWCKNNGLYGEKLLSEWTGLDENGKTIRINKVAKSSNKRVKWKCHKGHEWTVSINDRTRGRGCPYCYEEIRSDIVTQSRLKTGVNDLKTWCQNNGKYGEQILQEWLGLDENNQAVSINYIAQSSHRKVKWKCSKGHEWSATVNERTRGHGCPYCRGNHIVTDRNSLLAWCNNNGVLGQRIISEWTGLDENENPLSMDNVARASRKKVKWRCNKGHEWFAKISSRTSARTCCPYCSPIGTSYPEQYLYHALKQLYPNVENRCKVLKSSENPRGIEFDIGVPEIPLCIEYSPTYWHEGKEEYDEYKKQLCNEQGVRLIQIIEDSYDELEFKMDDDYICFHMVDTMKTDIVQVILEHILKSLNHTLDEIDLVKVEEDIQKTLELKGVQQGINDLYTWCKNNGEFGQRLINEWVGEDENGHKISMDSVARATPKKFKWKCSNKHEWFARIADRTIHKSGCPYCAGKKK